MYLFFGEFKMLRKLIINLYVLLSVLINEDLSHILISIIFFSKVSETITGKYWAEGPTAIRIGEYIYVYFDKYTEKEFEVLKAN